MKTSGYGAPSRDRIQDVKNSEILAGIFLVGVVLILSPGIVADRAAKGV
jgi:hypothetical protein